MKNYVEGKSIVITGAASGFGKIVSEKAAALGARLTCIDVDENALNSTVSAIQSSNGEAMAAVADVTDLDQMKRVITQVIQAYGRVDVMINNAGIMPLGFYADHETGADKWHRCIDINFKGVLNGIVAVYDQMMDQGEGHVINLSSIYGNFPVIGSAVYGATKSAVNFLSESLRVEAHGKIKVTIVKPTGVPGTNLNNSVVNPDAAIGIFGQNAPEFAEMSVAFAKGLVPAEKLDPSNMGYQILDPEHIADQIIYVINQPKGVSIGDITVRASDDLYIL